MITEKLHGKDIKKVLAKYNNNQSALGRASGTSKNIVLTLLIMKHGTLTMEDANTPEEIGAVQNANNFILREKLTTKQKKLFDFIYIESKKV